MSDLVAALDNALANYGEDIILRRVVGVAPNQVNIDVRCKARVDAVSAEQMAAGISATELNVIISPTQIANAQWPGGGVVAFPPFNIDQSVPRAGTTDKILMRGQPPKAVTFVDTKIIAGVVVRHDMRVSGQ